MPIAEDTELRQLTLEDAPALFALTVRNRDRLRRWMNWVDNVRCEEDTREFIRESLRNFPRQRVLQTGIYVRQELVGVIGMYRTANAVPEAELGYWIDQSAEGRGLVTQAARLLVQYAFERWQVQTVRIRVEPDNLRSRAIPERLGFVLRGETEEDWADGSHRSLMVYVMNANDFRKQDPPADNQ